jgi:hypothetical protein
MKYESSQFSQHVHHVLDIKSATRQTCSYSSTNCGTKGETVPCSNAYMVTITINTMQQFLNIQVERVYFEPTLQVIIDIFVNVDFTIPLTCTT